MHLLLVPRINVMLDFIWMLPGQLRGTRNKWTLHTNLAHGRIPTNNASRPPDYKFVVRNRYFIVIEYIDKSVNSVVIHKIFIYFTWKLKHLQMWYFVLHLDYFEPKYTTGLPSFFVIRFAHVQQNCIRVGLWKPERISGHIDIEFCRKFHKMCK